MRNEVRLRNIELNDLPIFYEQQLDADATRMAAFPARDRAAFDVHWARNRSDIERRRSVVLIDPKLLK